MISNYDPKNNKKPTVFCFDVLLLRRMPARLRLAAKGIVDRILQIAQINGIPIDRAVEYEMAISTIPASPAAA